MQYHSMAEADANLLAQNDGGNYEREANEEQLEQPLLIVSENDNQSGFHDAEDNQPDNEQENEEGSEIATSQRATKRNFERIALIILTGIVWASGVLFGGFMWGHYLLAPFSSWNVLLPHLYSRTRPVATFGIGLHFLGGSIAIMLGAIQLIEQIRKRWPFVHRWVGRIYILCSCLTAIGGLLFILRQGCIGGRLMDIAFSACAILTLLSAVQTYRYAAIFQDYEMHKLWAWRLYSLMIASWMYRIEYSVAMIFRIPHDPKHYSYALDQVMDFFFYVPNLLVVEVLWRTRHSNKPKRVSYVLGSLFLSVALVVLFCTVLEAYIFWIPGMIGKLHLDDDYVRGDDYNSRTDVDL